MIQGPPKCRHRGVRWPPRCAPYPPATCSFPRSTLLLCGALYSGAALVFEPTKWAYIALYFLGCVSLQRISAKIDRRRVAQSYLLVSIVGIALITNPSRYRATAPDDVTIG